MEQIEAFQLYKNEYGVEVVKWCKSCVHCEVNAGSNQSATYHCMKRKNNDGSFAYVNPRKVCGLWKQKPLYDRVGRGDGHELRTINVDELLRDSGRIKDGRSNRERIIEELS